jgi:hypothetical protein
MNRLLNLIRQSPSIAIATAALIMSAAGGATAATVANQSPAAGVTWHNLAPINGWQRAASFDFPPGYYPFDFPPGYYLDANHVVHLRGCVKHPGSFSAGTQALRLPRGVRPSHDAGFAINSGNVAETAFIFPSGLVVPADNTGSASQVKVLSCFDGVSFPLG